MRVTLFLAMALFAGTAFAQNQDIVKYSETITAEELKEHLSIIASDEYEGRYTGEKGIRMAADYLIKEFKGDELSGVVNESENPFLQQMELEKRTWTTKSMTIGEEVFENNKHMSMFQTGEMDEEVDVIFAGYGINSDNYDNYKNIDVKGKIVAFLMGEPIDKEGKYLVTGTDQPSLISDSTLNGKFMTIQGKAMASLMRGAKGLILIEQTDQEGDSIIELLSKYMGDTQVGFPQKGPAQMPEFPAIYMSPTQAARMFGITKADLDTDIENLLDTSIQVSGKYIQKAKLTATRTVDSVACSNVLAFIEGTDKKDEIVVITAHYDHDGVRNGEVINGADDNGSGTVSLIELAEAFAEAKKDGKGPRRSILFIAFTGEERGLLGSDFYARNPVFAMDSTVAAINIDMVGRIDKEHSDSLDYVYVIGSDYLSNELHTISENAAKTYTPDLKLDYTYNAKDHPEKLYYRSDQIKFAEKGVPVIFYFSGLHDDYHMPEDDVDKIAFEMLEKRIRLVFATVWEIANRDERLKVDVSSEEGK